MGNELDVPKGHQVLIKARNLFPHQLISKRSMKKKKEEEDIKVGKLNTHECWKCGFWYMESEKECKRCKEPNDDWKEIFMRTRI